jgi:hypothetical protein
MMGTSRYLITAQGARPLERHGRRPGPPSPAGSTVSHERAGCPKGQPLGRSLDNCRCDVVIATKPLPELIPWPGSVARRVRRSSRLPRQPGVRPGLPRQPPQRQRERGHQVVVRAPAGLVGVMTPGVEAEVEGAELLGQLLLQRAG